MRFLLPLVLIVPSVAFAAGDGAAPKPSKTTKSCKNGQVWDKKSKSCVNPSHHGLDEDTLYQAARELAYDGQYQAAQHVLASMADPQSDRALTYWGFTYRKMGQIETANAFYEQAIAKNPDNILARSYMAQGFVTEGRTDDAIAQWREIKARGGEGTWAEASLREAIRTGMTYNY
ncbi:tetratricopeptide repeat protein [Chachezhania sediminis]|uniref:tetratricopeptide repeat protein n=1 Tax=Chachezhania sediminis TaxID=2599291 RepID=UPI00131D181D|nr:tetratricopeptide repeat protein [Chachezhania sediminis]